MLLMPMLCVAQDDDPLSHRGVQYATVGTDFWVCFPRTLLGRCRNASRIYVVSERDCDVTITNEWLGYSQTYHVMRRQMCSFDTNYLFIPYSISGILDTVNYVRQQHLCPLTPYRFDTVSLPVPQHDYTGTACDLPQPKGFHVTSTDTIALSVVIGSTHGTACNILPTEMLRDEYVAQPPISCNRTLRGTRPEAPIFYSGISNIDIVAADDSVTVDIVLSDWDWLNRRPGDTLTVMLRRGQLYHISAGETQEKYYPSILPHHNPCIWQNATDVAMAPVTHHTFTDTTSMRDTFAVDLSGTRIKARDCKRIAVFESSGILGCGIRGGQFITNMMMEQSVPVFYAGKEYLIPNWGGAIRFTGLHDNTAVTIYKLTPPNRSRVLMVNSGKTNWWETESDVPYYYILSTQPVLVKWIGNDLCTMLPTRWWHWGRMNFGTLNEIDENQNVTSMVHTLDIFTRTENVPSMWMDSYNISSYFQPVPNTPYSYARLPGNSSFNSWGTHYIVSRTEAPFMAYSRGIGMTYNHTVNLPHIQPGGVYMTVNGVPHDSVPSDSIWCMYDPVTFNAWNVRPCDSLIWDFGDGTVLRYSYSDEEFEQPQVYTWHDTGRFTVRAVFKYQDEGCFTRKSDTLSAPIWIHNHYDSTFSVRLCEGSYTFRGQELDHTDTHYITTYWTESGCDTLWQIDLVTCPHCHWVYDTVAPEDMPVLFNGISFGSETHDEPVYLHIGDTCDSIIYYTLIVIPYWGEKPIDSTWILAPNVITPTQESNNIFSLYCSPHILRAEVTVYDRHGERVARFDGLTGSWDGNADTGQPCRQGTYVYHIRYIDTHDNGWKTLTGTVTLLR